MKDILDSPFIYRLWQAPFNHQKVAPVREYEHLWRGKSVLDIGCGPGINVGLFESASRYVGIDVNEDYVMSAASRHKEREFFCHDALTTFPDQCQPELIFCSSLLHHFNDSEVEKFFCTVQRLTIQPVPFILVDLVLPERVSLAHGLAKADRGSFARSIDNWKNLLSPSLEIELLRPFTINRWGFRLWELFILVGMTKEHGCNELSPIEA